MTLTRWNPFREMLTMQTTLDRMLEESRPAFNESNALPLDIYEDETSYRLRSAVAGADPDSIQVRLHDGVLTISAEVRSAFSNNREREATENASENGNGNGNGNGSHQSTPKRRVLIQENVYGKYTRSIRLPEAVDEEGVTADYENGVLQLTLPKIPKAQPKQIAVQLKK